MPEGASPPGLELRRAFLLEQLRRMAERRTRSTGAAGGVAVPVAGAGPLRVLDVGCGEGQLTAAIAEAGYEVLGLDVADEPLRRSRSRYAGLAVRRVEPRRRLAAPRRRLRRGLGGGDDRARRRHGPLAVGAAPRAALRRQPDPQHPRARIAGAARALRSPRAASSGISTRAPITCASTRAARSRICSRTSVSSSSRCATAGGLPGARRTLLASAVRSRFQGG